MKTIAKFGLLISVALACADGVLAQSQAGPRSLPRPGGWTLTPEAGTELSNSGKVISGAAESVTAAGNLFGGVVSATINFSANTQKFRDVYDRPLSAGLGGSYGLTNDSEVFGRFRYTTADARDFTALNVNAAVTFNGVAILAGNGSLTGKMNDYNETLIDLGYRKFFRHDDMIKPFLLDMIKPFLSGSVGFQRNNGLDLDLSYRGVAVLNDVKLYKSSTVPSVALGIGAIYDIGGGASLGVETGYRWAGKIKENDASLTGGRSFEGINNNFRRYVVPLMISVRVPL